MRWKKLGKIFDPRAFHLANNCVEFAQSPQALVFEDFVRIYFSTRERDPSGKYLSHISFVDMDKGMARVLRVADAPVLALGRLGCYDEHGVFPLNVVRIQGRILGFIGGWSRRVSVSVETSIGLALSEDDGLTFTRVGDGPVLTSSPDEPFLVGDPFVAFHDGQYHMWYIYGKAWIPSPGDGAPQRVYKIGHAVSGDAMEWRRDGAQLIPDRLNQDECQALPTVIRIGDRYHMFFCYRQAIGFRNVKACGYRIGYAYSDDLQVWVRSDELSGIDVSEQGWDSDMQCYPHVFQCGDQVYLLYNGNEFGRTGFGLAVLEDPGAVGP